jgi:hypothetical protein
MHYPLHTSHYLPTHYPLVVKITCLGRRADHGHRIASPKLLAGGASVESGGRQSGNNWTLSFTALALALA